MSPRLNQGLDGMCIHVGRSKMLNRRTALAACSAALVLTGSCLADIVDVRFTGTGLGRNVRTDYLGSAHNVFAGQLTHAFADGSGSAAFLDGPRITYCTELTEYVTGSFREYALTPLQMAPDSDPMGADAAQALTDVWVHADGRQFLTESTAANRDFAAAFQITVWEIVHDYDGTVTSLDVNAGDLTVTRTNGQALTSGIAGYVSELFGAVGANTTFSGLGAVSRAGAQDQLVAVPTPGALALCVIAIVPLAGTRRRRLA
jgi:hypothetical protein